MLKPLHKITNILIVFLMVTSLVTGCGPVTPIASPATIEAATQAAVTEDVNVSNGSTDNQEVWLDASLNVMQFSPSENFVVHFKSPVSPASSLTPVLVWPNVEGISSWSEDHTTLTFDPEISLDGKKTYTFFLDPALRFEDGSALNSSAEWSLYVKSAPQVVRITPTAGAVDNLFKTIQINFDKKIVTRDAHTAVNITPPVPFDAVWKSEKILIITLKSPLSANQRYDLTLKSGEFEAEDGSVFADDYNWFYWQKPFEVNAVVTGEKSVQFDFSYKVDMKKSEFPFEISPPLTGEWTWMSPQKLLFVSNEPILSATEYTLSNTTSLINPDGFEIEQIPEATFSGKPPIKLVMAGFEKRNYGIYVKEYDIEAIRIEFQTPVDHASAEAAFSITPAIAGTFEWEQVGDTQKEVLVYTLDELFAQSNASYKIIIDSKVIDPAGKKIMMKPFQVDFGTGYNSYLSPSFGQAGDNIQIVDANGPRRIQIYGNDPNISFSAYRFDLSDYVILYEKYYHSRRYDSNLHDIPISDELKPTLTWYAADERELAEDRIVVETTLPLELLPGLYVVNMKVKDRLYDQLFVVVSENTMVIKNDGDDLYVWVTNINGDAVANAQVRVYSKTGEKIREGVTDENGEYQVAVPADEQLSFVSAFVKEPGRPNDAIVTGVDSTWSAYLPYDYDEWQSERELPEGKPYLTYIYTERPLYRPGQTVNFKILLRKDDDVKYSLLEAGALVNVRVKDARGNNVNSFELALNEFGTVNGSVDISSEAMLGIYTIEAEVDGIVSQESFRVEDYRKPDYQISLTPLQPERSNQFVRGEEVQFKLHAAYYFGEPLANARVKVNFILGWKQLNAKVSGKLITDDNGDVTLAFKAPYDNEQYSSWYWGVKERVQTIRMEVSIAEGSNQGVTTTQTLFVHPSSEELSLDTGGYYQLPNQPFPVTVATSTLAGEPVENRDISLVIYKWNYEEYEFDTQIDAIEMKTSDQGQVTKNVTLTSGYYKLSLFSEDSEGRKIEYSRWIYVFKNKNDWVFRNWEKQIQISSEKESYKPYEKARFMIESTFSGPALITFERGSVINSKFIELTAPLTILETDIIPEHAPNVYVTVNAWQPVLENVHRYGYWDTWSTRADSYLRIDRTQILVDATGKELDIDIETDKQTYEPGEKVTATIRVTDAQGNPTAAELSLAVVDEAIFGLVNPFEENIFTAFYGPRGHTVGTFDSMEPYRYVPGDMGGGGDEGPPETRQDFLDTSAWLPVIRTDENGQGIVTFDLPDNTTSWRLTVKAVTLNHQVGESKINIETKKEVFLRPILPRVLTRGDKALLTSFIHNYSDEDKTLTVELQADGLILEEDANQIVSLKPGEVLPISWRVLVDRATPTSFKVVARDGDKVLDAVEMPVLIQPAAVLDVQNQSGEFSGTLALPLLLPDVDMETSQVTLSLNQSISGTLLNGLDYLIGYPYGCVEQTMSRALPNAVVARASEQLGVGGPDLSKRLDPYIQASIAKLYSLQHSDGGWGWWLYDSSTEYQTAWVLFGLGLIKRAGYEVEPQVMDRAAEWLRYSLRDGVDPRTRAYVLYSLAVAGRGNLEETQKLVDTSINELDPFSQAALASALNQMGETEQAKEILNLLSQSALERNGEVYWTQPTHDGEYNSKTMSSTTRTTAMVLLAFAEIEPQHEFIPGMVKYLAAQREGIYGWGTTNETTFAILALTQYLISQENTVEPIPYQVNINGKELFIGILEVGNTSAQLQIPVSELSTGVNSILVSTQGGRPIYFDLSTKYDLLQDSVEAAGSIKVTRQYLDVETKKIITSFVPGQLVKVQVIVQMPENGYFFAVEDHLPGGLEALNEGLGFSNVYDPYAWEYNNWGEFGYNYKEIRGDRVVFFISELEKGKHTFTYYARATTAGEFLALPVQAYAMYDLAIWGRSESTEIVVR